MAVEACSVPHFNGWRSVPSGDKHYYYNESDPGSSTCWELPSAASDAWRAIQGAAWPYTEHSSSARMDGNELMIQLMTEASSGQLQSDHASRLQQLALLVRDSGAGLHTHTQ